MEGVGLEDGAPCGGRTAPMGGLGASTTLGAVVPPSWQWSGTSRPIPPHPGPLARTCKPRLPPALPASCQGTFLCVFPLGASLVREMFFCEGRGTGWDLPRANPLPQPRWPCKPA